MDNKIQITGINIKVKGKELTLTVDEARELKKELDALLEVKFYQPWVPYVVHHYPTPPFRYGEITCGGIGNGVQGFSDMQRLSSTFA